MGVAKIGSLTALVALLVYLGSKDCLGAQSALSRSIFSGIRAVNRSVFSAADANMNIEVRPRSGAVSCDVRGGCMCDCYWSYNPGACNMDDWSCCYDCCCHPEHQKKIPPPPPLVVPK